VVAFLLLGLKTGDRSEDGDDGAGGEGEEMAMESCVRGVRCRFCGERGANGGRKEMVVVWLPAFGVSELDGALRLVLLVLRLVLPLLLSLLLLLKSRSGGGGNVYAYGDVLDEPGEVMALVTTDEMSSSSMDSSEGC